VVGAGSSGNNEDDIDDGGLGNSWISHILPISSVLSEI
jgi:hypothetical protein